MPMQKHSVPSRLNTPPTSKVKPPVVSKKQDLPFGELSWEDFEKLCLRLAAIEADIEFCRLYGVRGDKQLGIDIFARKIGKPKFTVYQCKREKAFGSAKITKAVEKFDNGEWKLKSDTFVLCTQESLQRKERSDALEKQREHLKTQGISLLSWDNHHLSLKLKKHPEIVYDFFGLAWVEGFCGSEFAAGLKNRLSGNQVEQFRTELGGFYKSVFNTQDPGLPLAASTESLALQIHDRFVVPDVMNQSSIELASKVQSSSDPEPRVHDPNYYFELQSGTIPAPRNVARPLQTVQNRNGVEPWLLESDRNLVLGDPGSGKTTLLRFIAIDLLQSSPSLERLSQRWGCFLPVWIPFALWTQLVSKKLAETSLVDVLKNWLAGFNEERLVPLVEAALNDERLLLLVDGLDEWSNEEAAQIALDRLKVFVEQRNVPVIATSRMRGIERLSIPTTGWSVGRLADFSIAQQEELVASWFSCWNSNASGNQLSVDTEIFMAELNRNPDLRDLAKKPMLLLFLVYHRLHQSALPEGRFKAYDSMINHLLSTQPRKRRIAANIVGELSHISVDDSLDAFARIAFEIQSNKTSGTIHLEDAKATLESYLMDEDVGLGIGHREARQMSGELLTIGQDETGLMVRRSTEEVGFFHRAFHEHLAAVHLSQLPFAIQIDLVSSHGTDPQWHETLLCLFSMIRRRDDFDNLVAVLEEAGETASQIGRKTIESMLSEIAFGNFACPPKTSKRIASKAFEIIERGDWMPHRERILRLAVNGIRSTPINAVVKEKLAGWFPGRIKWRSSIYEAMGSWDWTGELSECLWNGIHDEELSNQRAAAQTLSKLKHGDVDIGNKLGKLAIHHSRPSVRVASLECLMNGWQDHSSIETAIKLAHESTHPNSQILALVWRVDRALQTDEDKTLLLKLSRSGAGLYDFHSAIVHAIVKGWPDDQEFKEACLKSVAQGNSRYAIDNHVGTSVLLNGYSGDVDVAKVFANEIERSDHPFVLRGLSNVLQVLSGKFDDCHELKQSVDSWLERQKLNGPEQMNAAIFTKSDRARKRLLSMLNDRKAGWRFWAAEGLLQGWPGDPEALKALEAIANGENNSAAGLSMQLSRIIPDRKQCQDRLIEFMQDKSVRRHDLVARAIVELGVGDCKFDLIDTALNKVIPKLGIGNIDTASISSTLIRSFPDDTRVKDLAKQCLLGRAEDLSKPSLSVIASSYPKDIEIQQSILELMLPLNDQLRATVVQELETATSDPEFLKDFFAKYDDEFHGEIKTAASIVYHRTLERSGIEAKPAVADLKKSIACYGLDHEARRQAAFCGLAELKRLDVMTEGKGHQECWINLFDGSAGGPNVPLLHYILSNWAEIKFELRDAFWSRLNCGNDIKNPWADFWNFAHQYDQPCSEALEYIESNGPQLGIAGLQFLERVRPKSNLLFGNCIKVFGLGNNAIDVSGEIAVFASDILGAHFFESNELLDSVNKSRREGHIYGKEVLALIEAHPNDKLIQQAYVQLTENNRYFADEVALRLICRVGNVGDVENWIDRLCSAVQLPHNSFLMYARPIVQRISTDSDLQSRLIDKLNSQSTGSEKVTILKLMTASVGLIVELRDWCETELEYQAKVPEIGMDVFSRSYISVENAILDCAMPESFS